MKLSQLILSTIICSCASFDGFRIVFSSQAPFEIRFFRVYFKSHLNVWIVVQEQCNIKNSVVFFALPRTHTHICTSHDPYLFIFVSARFPHHLSPVLLHTFCNSKMIRTEINVSLWRNMKNERKKKKMMKQRDRKWIWLSWKIKESGIALPVSLCVYLQIIAQEKCACVT